MRKSEGGTPAHIVTFSPCAVFEGNKNLSTQGGPCPVQGLQFPCREITLLLESIQESLEEISLLVVKCRCYKLLGCRIVNGGMLTQNALQQFNLESTAHLTGGR
ncbi:hypothetical protein AVEN_250696-1 [Araneus ventricosus]|uniref:Uncharacterized protein n=1 Tax=Araneus ventricosus TaxID=182803 RepID=A0A4Y2U3A6_ARAVE|nr:hypothetical protein AVEN_250696-1 [Araneus ventricosus]